MRRLHIDRVLTGAAVFIAVMALAIGKPGDIEIATVGVLIAIIGKA